MASKEVVGRVEVAECLKLIAWLKQRLASAVEQGRASHSLQRELREGVQVHTQRLTEISERIEQWARATTGDE